MHRERAALRDDSRIVSLWEESDRLSVVHEIRARIERRRRLTPATVLWEPELGVAVAWRIHVLLIESMRYAIQSTGVHQSHTRMVVKVRHDTAAVSGRQC